MKTRSMVLSITSNKPYLWTRLFLLISMASLGQSCYTKEMLDCLSTNGSPPHHPLDNDYFPHYSPHEFNLICSSLDKMPPCESIMGMDSQKYNSHVLVCGFLCKEGYQKYNVSQRCYERPESTEIGHRCNHTYTINMGSIGKGGESFFEYQQQLCRNLIDFGECLRRGLANVCQMESVKRMHEIKMLMFAPLFDQFNCKIDYQLSVLEVFGIALGSLGFLCCVATAYIIYKRRRTSPISGRLAKNPSRCRMTSSTSKTCVENTAEQTVPLRKRNSLPAVVESLEKSPNKCEGNTPNDCMNDNKHLLIEPSQSSEYTALSEPSQ